MPLSARKPPELLSHPHPHQFPTPHLWALSHQEGPALPLMQDILLDLRLLFSQDGHCVLHVSLDPRLLLAICCVFTVLAFCHILT